MHLGIIIVSLVISFLLIGTAGAEKGALEWYQEGAAHVKAGELKSALNAFEGSTTVDPELKERWLGKGVVFANQGRHLNAVPMYEIAIGKDPTYKEAWYDLGISFSALEKDEEALTAYNMALEIDDRYVFALDNKGVLMEKMGRSNEAFDLYVKAMEIDPGVKKWKFEKDGSEIGKSAANEASSGSGEAEETPGFTWLAALATVGAAATLSRMRRKV